MDYVKIDPVISAWALRHDVEVSIESGGQERRFCYLSGGPQECFQISIDPPYANKVLIHARDVETSDDAEMHEAWFVHVEDLDSALELAFSAVTAWKDRQKGRPTWTSPTS